MNALPQTTASVLPLFACSCLSRSLYAFLSTNLSGSAGSMSVNISSKLPGSTSCSIRCRALMRKWYWHFGHTCCASSTTLRKSMSSHSGQRIHSPSGIPSFCCIRGSLVGTCDITIILTQLLPQFRYGRGPVGLVENRAGDDEPVDARVARGRDRLDVDAAVDLQPLVRLKPLLYRDGLGQHFGHESLAAESRHDAHDQHDVDVVQRRQDRVNWCRRPQRDADVHAELANGFGRLDGVADGLHVKGDVVRPGLHERRRVLQRLVDHQVHVE